jgi:hypothetical protein
MAFALEVYLDDEKYVIISFYFTFNLFYFVSLLFSGVKDRTPIIDKYDAAIRGGSRKFSEGVRKGGAVHSETFF